MNIIVCIKQVPATNEVKLDPQTNTIVREGVEAIINPFDMFAIEEAVRLKEKLGGKVTALSMGIPRVADLLREALSLGVDEAVLLSDRNFAGADTLATAYTLAKAVRKIDCFDLIICGKQAADGDTAQVGPSLAEKLGIAHTTYVSRIEEINTASIRCSRMTDEGYETVELALPAVITVVKEINTPRLPSIKGLRRAKEAEIRVWTAEDIGADPDKTGLRGSPTQVVRTFVPVHEVKSEMIGGTAEEQAKKLAGILLDLNLIPG
ncbi:MAG: electron transfer flavoprotein subunit beta/FixA family protein [Peptococcaceae bacterium]|nr:electron transfer flavoprotein subunit beta/FixA family protein [Peptococcaceae bacterium]MDH7526094.1 electron transfer flavoprotein subunit beta/FixA family protein [Peptococcaceae bacterium]